MVRFKFMKLVSILILVATAVTAAAKGRLEIFPIPDPDLGSFTVTVEDVNHPMLLPYRLKVMVACKNRPQEMRELQFEVPEYGMTQKGEGAKVCRYHLNSHVIKPIYERERKTLTVEYYISTTPEGEGKCDTKVEQPFYLDQLCAPSAR